LERLYKRPGLSAFRSFEIFLNPGKKCVLLKITKLEATANGGVRACGCARWGEKHERKQGLEAHVSRKMGSVQSSWI
jgi:hypothetical protein